MLKNYLFLVPILLMSVSNNVNGQEIKIFTTADFDLRGNVKKCLVRTDYGKEEYEFNREGLLTKSITRYNEQDYDITYYRYKGDELTEKRLEIYRDKEFDKSTSIANFYIRDTTDTLKITEKIVSYTEEFLDQYEYFYDQHGNLTKIIRTNDNGIDETNFEYDDLKGEKTKTAIINGTVLETVRTSVKELKDKSKQTITLTKRFINGEPTKAVEVILNAKNKVVTKTEYEFDLHTNQFAAVNTVGYTYDPQGILLKTIHKKGDATTNKEYIYQFDANENLNWVKQIITPDNTYKTREISYFKDEVKVEKG
ncbi:MAG: hypothetical protein WBM83_07710 [Flavobacteriaceae bacterium]